MFTVGLLSSHLPYALALVAYVLLHFTGKPEFNTDVFDLSIDHFIVNSQLPNEEIVSSAFIVKVDNKSKVLSYLKLESEDIVARSCSHQEIDLSLSYQTPYLTTYSYLRPPPVI